LPGPCPEGPAPAADASDEGTTTDGETAEAPAEDAGRPVRVAATERRRGALTLIEALALLGLGKLAETPQDDSRATYAPKVDREATRINWSETALGVSRAIRAYDPTPGAFTQLRGKDVKFFGAKVVSGASGKPGEILAGEPSVVVACAQDAVAIADVQPAGKSRMPDGDWVRGRAAAIGDVLGA